jgi:hypothetical protein
MDCFLGRIASISNLPEVGDPSDLAGGGRMAGDDRFHIRWGMISVFRFQSFPMPENCSSKSVFDWSALCASTRGGCPMAA